MKKEHERLYIGKLVSKKTIAKNTFEYVFELDRLMHYKAGQYVWIELKDIKSEDPKGSRRAFSLITAPDDSHLLSIIFREGTSDFKLHLSNISVNSTVNIIGPFGSSFKIEDQSVDSYCLIAGGVGIAPFISIIQECVKTQGYEKKITLLFQNSSPSEAVYHDWLKEISDTYDFFTFKPIYGKKIALADIKDCHSSLNTKWLVSGPQGFVNYIADILSSHGIEKSNIIFEQYYPIIKNKLLKDLGRNLLHVQSGEEDSYNKVRGNFINTYLPRFILISVFFAFISSLSLSLLNRPYMVYLIEGFVLFGLYVVWNIKESIRNRIIEVGISSIAITLLLAFLLVDYQKSSIFWLNIVPISSLFFLKRKGIYWIVLYYSAVFVLSILFVADILPHSLDTIEIVQTNISLLFVSSLSLFYELIVDKTGAFITKSNEMRDIFRQAIESTTNHLVITDTNGIVLYANRAASVTTGYQQEEIIGNTPRLWGGMESDTTYRELWNKLKSGESYVGELVNRRKNHELYYALAHISPIKTKKGEIMGYIGAEEDVTKLRKSEEKAQESTERFLSLTERIPEIYWITELEPEEHVVYTSPAFEKIWGMSREDLYKNPRLWIDKIHEKDRQKVHALFRKFLQGEEQYDIEYVVVGSNGTEYIIHDVAELILDENGSVKRVVGVARDITKEKQLDMAKDEFISIASHELRTPLTAIDGLTSMILDGEYGEVVDNLVQPLKDISASSERLILLVNDLLSVSRMQAGRLKYTVSTFTLNDVLGEAVNLLSVVAQKKGLSLSTDTIVGVEIQGDTDKVKQVINNLVGNAIKFTDSGGISISSRVVEEFVEISIRDTGIGISEEDRVKLFEKFEQLDSGQGRPAGTGLGLYISRELCRKMGGDLKLIESKQPGGSTFAIYLPLKGTRSATQAEKRIAEEAALHPDQKSDKINVS